MTRFVVALGLLLGAGLIVLAWMQWGTPSTDDRIESSGIGPSYRAPRDVGVSTLSHGGPTISGASAREGRSQGTLPKIQQQGARLTRPAPRMIEAGEPDPASPRRHQAEEEALDGSRGRGR